MLPEPIPVPAWLHGCWRRAWIQFADGSRNDTDPVFWLQTDSAMADVRPGNASTGYTVADDLATDPDGSHRCVAQWHTYGVGANFQPEVTFPEPGLLHVNPAGDVMMEHAPSGAYMEEWHLVEGSADTPPTRRVLGDGRELFTAGPVMILTPCPATAVPLECQFIVAIRHDDGEHRVVTSTLPCPKGSILDLPA